MVFNNVALCSRSEVLQWPDCLLVVGARVKRQIGGSGRMVHAPEIFYISKISTVAEILNVAPTE